tara:strand:- start:3151 stop:3390 length:240 start_codon:yes stop_codon:yes gene_type:complete
MLRLWWEEYRAHCVPIDATPEAVNAARESFYAGIYQLSGTIDASCEGGDLMAGVALLATVRREIETFKNQILDDDNRRN